MTDLQSSYKSGKSNGSSNYFENLNGANRHIQNENTLYQSQLDHFDNEADNDLVGRQAKTISLGNGSKNVILWIEQAVKRRLFEINHVLLANQGVIPLMYHVILLFEFIQLLFFIFYKVEVTNEFASSNSNDTTILSPSNSTRTSSKFRIDYYFTFTNFQIYILQQQSSSSFIILYSILTGLFMVFIGLLLALSDKLFIAERSDNLKEGTKYLVKFFSLLMTAFLFILQIPMITIYLQAYLCDEDPNTAYTLKDMTCFSTTHQVLIVISTISLVIYLVFLILQSLLYTSNSFESSLPWSSLERHLSIVRVFLKLVLAACFVFDKQGKIRGQIDLVCFILSFYVVYKRYDTALIFNKSVFYAMIVYEIMQMWLFLFISIHIMGDFELTIVGLLLMIISSLLISLAMIFWQQYKSSFFLQRDISTFKHASELEIYFFQIFQLINEDTAKSKIILHGLLCNHMYQCTNEKCPCINIMQIQDNVKVNNDRLELNSNNQNSQFQTINQDQIDINLEKDANVDLRRRTTRSNIYDQFGNNGLSTLNEFKTIGDNKNHGTLSRVTMNGGMFNTRTRRNIRYTLATVNNISDQQRPQERVLTERKKRKQLYQWYRFLTLMIESAIERFPKHIELKIISSFVQNRKLKNEFKSIFQLMNAEQCNPNFQDQFIIFRRKIQIEQLLKKTYQKSIQEIGKIDVQQIYKYERYFQSYQILEYETALSAYRFWRELLQKEIDSEVLQQFGAQISENYEKIQQLVDKICKIYPQDIKFFFRYGTFLFQIINNAYDALVYFEKIYYTFHGRQSKKNIPFNELSIFGENSGCAIIIISATSKIIGNIIHANEEVETILGFKRRDILFKNISILMPIPIGKVHDKFIERYFDTAQPTVIDVKRQQFAVSDTGYLRAVRLLVKVYPHISSRIVFIGFMQSLDKFDDMEQPKHEYLDIEQQYIVTDNDANITNVTEGLNLELGLNSKFFKYSDSIFQTLFNFQKICPEINQYDIQEQLEDEGCVLNIDTTNMLQHIELESLSSEEILDIKTKLGLYECYIQLKTLILDKNFCTIKIYRVCIINKMQESMRFTGNIIISKHEDELNELQSTNLGEPNSLNEYGDILSQSQMASWSTSTSGSYSFNKVMKDFKKALGERKTPRVLIHLHRIILVFNLLMLTLGSIDYGLKQSSFVLVNKINQQGLMIQSREFQYIQLVSNVRSLVNIANNIEFGFYDIIDSETNLNIDRFQYLKDYVTIQEVQMAATHDYLSQQRDQKATKTNAAQKIQDKEYENINLYRVETNQNISSYQLQFRVALNLYLSYLQDIAQKNKTDFIIPQNLLKATPFNNSKINNQTVSEQQKVICLLILNGLRDLRKFNYGLVSFYIDAVKSSSNTSIFLAIMIISIVSSFMFLFTLLYQVFKIERNKIRILQLYGLLQLDEIREVHQKCDKFLESLQYGHLKPKKKQSEFYTSQMSSQYLGMNSSNALNHVVPGGVSQRQDSLVSEEEKEAQLYKQFMRKKRAQKFRSQQIMKGNILALNSGQVGPTEEKQKLMIKYVMDQIKEIQTNELEQIEKQKVKRKKDGLPYNAVKKVQIVKKKAKTSVDGNEFQYRDDLNNSQKNLKSSMSKQKKNASDPEDQSNQSQHQVEIQNSANDIPNKFTEEEIIDRQKMFSKQIKSVRWAEHVKTLILGLLVVGYFIYAYTFTNYAVSQIGSLLTLMPNFYDRYANLILSFNFLREGMVNLAINPNQTMDELSYKLGFEINDIANYYQQKSLENQQKLNTLKNDAAPEIIEVIQFFKEIDSSNFCNYTQSFHQSQSYLEDFPEFKRQSSYVSQNCETFQIGLLSKGIQQALGTFNKKFTDLQISLNNSNTKTPKLLQEQMLLLLRGSKASNNSLIDNTFKSYFQVQELYFYDMIEQLTEKWRETFLNLNQFMITIVQALYFVFLAIMLILLLIGRQRFIHKLKMKVFLSRGILNLIPENFFEQNKDDVEKLIKQIKD
eukprot:403371996